MSRTMADLEVGHCTALVNVGWLVDNLEHGTGLEIVLESYEKHRHSL